MEFKIIKLINVLELEVSTTVCSSRKKTSKASDKLRKVMIQKVKVIKRLHSKMITN
jgi:hypothetical protein